MKVTTAAWALAALLIAAPGALAATPQPAKPVPSALYSGRWYEIARTPNHMQTNCQASTNDFFGWSPNGFSVVQTCHKGSPSGPKQTMSAHGSILPASANAKMRLGIMGGLLSQEYWILDRADNDAWAIMDRADGRYVWLLSRQPLLTGTDKAEALARLKALGFDLTRLTFPQQLPQS